MSRSANPHFVIKNKFQKGGVYRDLLSKSVLADICFRITGQEKFTVEFDDAGYNIGRLVMLYFKGRTFYISVSEKDIRSRNASFQSFPSALSRYILDKSPRKSIYFYIYPTADGNFETDYFIFMYRLMKTVGVNLINISEHVSREIRPFADAEDMIAAKESLRSKAKGNRSTYVTRSMDGAVQVYAKTYGANKYESTLLCLALVAISSSAVELYEVEEGGLKSLPAMSKEAILAAGDVSIQSSNAGFETEEFIQNNSLRSIRYIFNLLEKFERKKCAFCECEIAQIIQGAHIWPVAAIKKEVGLPLKEQLKYAIDGHNGLWLCENHHRLFDTNMIYLSSAGSLKYHRSLVARDVEFLQSATATAKLSNEILSIDFLGYLRRRNEAISESLYLDFDKK